MDSKRFFHGERDLFFYHQRRQFWHLIMGGKAKCKIRAVFPEKILRGSIGAAGQKIRETAPADRVGVGYTADRIVFYTFKIERHMPMAASENGDSLFFFMLHHIPSFWFRSYSDSFLCVRRFSSCRWKRQGCQEGATCVHIPGTAIRRTLLPSILSGCPSMEEYLRLRYG